MDDHDMIRQTQVFDEPPNSAPYTPNQPIGSLSPARPGKQPSGSPSRGMQDSVKKLVDSYIKMKSLLEESMKLATTEVDSKFFYAQLKEMQKDFNRVIVLGGRKKMRRTKKRSRY